MNEKFEIIEVPPDQAQRVEAMGTKFKFWYKDKHLGECLYKKSRQNTGEDWAEKIAAELSELLNLPHAAYELALCNGHRGTVSKNFLPPNTSLTHGNEILLKLIQNYPPAQEGQKNFYRVSQHRLDVVMDIMELQDVDTPIGWNPPQGIKTGLDTFIGYLLLDAWIGNTDRHHENWAFLRGSPPRLHLAPSYDHASSLGRNESTESMNDRLTTKDQGRSVGGYVEKCRSAFYDKIDDKKPLTTFEAFKKAKFRKPVPAKIWLDRLGEIRIDEVNNFFDRIPDDRISKVAIKFGQKILELNRNKLLELI
ncbi:MAG: HipA-like protein [Phycisphaerae bacterium]